MLIKDSKNSELLDWDPFKHRVAIPPDDGSKIDFKWHFPRGTLQPRMTAYELAGLILFHMPAIIPLLSGHPRVQQEFQAMFVQLATKPGEVTDRLVPWIRAITRTEDDDIIFMSLYNKTEQPAGPTYFVLNGATWLQ